jgi:hypothetical protein
MTAAAYYSLSPAARPLFFPDPPETIEQPSRVRRLDPDLSNLVKQFNQPAMPYKKSSKKKTYRKKRKYSLDPGVKALSYSLNRQIRNDKQTAALTAALGKVVDAATIARANVGARQTYMEGIGRGSYKFGKAVQRFGQGKFGSALKGHALSLMDTGVGMLTGRGMYTGRGEYTDNALIDTGLGVAEEVPVFASAGDETGMVCVSKKEYICDIYGPSQSFNCQAFSLNPGLESTFPWLSQIAQNYDEYDFKQLMFTFRSTTTDIGSSTSGQCGTVIMATNYNAAAPAFQDKVTMMEYDSAMSCKATESMRHGVECDPAKLSGSEGKFVRNNPVVIAQDLKTYDHGLFQLGVANAPAAYVDQSLGELWVTYTVELRKPKFYANRGLGISQDIFVSGAGSETSALWMGTNAALLQGQQNNIGVRLTLDPNLITFTFPASYAGFLEIKLVSEGLVTISNWLGAQTFFGNVAGVADLYASGGFPADPPDSFQAGNTAAIALGGKAMYIIHLQIGIATNGTDNQFSVGLINAATPPTQSMITISEYNSGYSYRAANIGPVGAQSQAPILVNQQGVIVVP